MWSPVTGAAFADGIFAGLPVFEAIQHIDPAVLAAIQASTAEHIHGLPSVHSYVAQHFFDAPTQTADGWFERLTGYVAEQKAASALEAAGHHVTFAATANQPVWDLLVDGHPVQVKEGISGVKAYLLEHHGVPIYTGNDVAAAAKDPIVHGLAGMDSSHIHTLTHQSVDGISDVFDSGFHFPIITLAFSSYRETLLLFDEKTTIQRAAKNVGMDVIGVGAGTFAGAKLGAAIGAFFTPAGAAAGALVGGIVGGVGGKMASTSFRYAPFRAAFAEYEEWTGNAQVAVDMAIEGSKDRIAYLQSSFQEEYIGERELIHRHAANQLRALSKMSEMRLLQFAEVCRTR
jgi:hypothetical protein